MQDRHLTSYPSIVHIAFTTPLTWCCRVLAPQQTRIYMSTDRMILIRWAPWYRLGTGFPSPGGELINQTLPREPVPGRRTAHESRDVRSIKVLLGHP
jgi:hypothetical protein